MAEKTRQNRDDTKYKSEAYNIIIRPSSGVENITIEMNKSLRASSDCFFALGPNTYPHVTLFQAQFPVRNLDAIKESVRKIAESNRPFVIQMGDVVHHSDYGLNGFVFWNCAEGKDSQLALLQKQVLRDTNKLREGLLLPSIAAMDQSKLTEEQRSVINEYGSSPPMIMPYESGPVPFHITIGRIKDSKLETKAIDKKTVTFIVDKISIGRLGEHGIVTEILDEFDLKRN